MRPVYFEDVYTPIVAINLSGLPKQVQRQVIATRKSGKDAYVYRFGHGFRLMKVPPDQHFTEPILVIGK